VFNVVMSLLRRRDVRLLLAGYALSALGDYLALLVLTIRVHDLTGSGLAVAGLLLAGIVPTLVLGPVAGYLVDRFETVRVLVAGALASAGFAVGLALTTNLTVLYLLAFGLGAAATATRPAVFALLPRVVDEAELVRANSLVEVAQFGGATLGPFLGGLLSAQLGTGWALLLNAGTFLALAVAGAALRVRRHPAAAGGGPDRPGEELRRGVALMVSDRVLLLAVGVVVGLVLFVAAGNVAEVFLAKDVLRAGDAGFGLLTAGWAAGMVAGVLLLAGRVPPGRMVNALLAAAAVTGLATMVAGAAPVLAVAVIAYVAGGGANGIANVAVRTLIQQRVPDGLRGRAYGTYAAAASAAELAATGLGGIAVATLGARGTLIAGGTAALLVATVATLFWLRLGPEVRAPAF
jgi:MFS family permease